MAANPGVSKNKNEHVCRNIDQFPEDVVFQLTKAKFANLKSQMATLSSGWKGRRKAPFVFILPDTLKKQS
jgi:hypothetical protein